MMRRLLTVVVLGWSCGCGSSGSTPDGGSTGDGATTDGPASTDAEPEDAAVTIDAGPPCGTGTEIYAARAVIQFPVVAGGTLYFSEFETVAELRSVSTGGGASTLLATANGNIFGVAVDGTNVYWLDESATRMAGTLKKKPVGGGAEVTLASGLAYAHSVAQDANNIYFGATRNMRVSLHRVGKTATAPGSEVVVCAHATTSGGMIDIDVSGTTAYWSTAMRPSIYSTTTTGTAQTCVEQVLGPEQPGPLTINGTDLVYGTVATGAVGMLFRQPVGTTARQSIYTGTELHTVRAQAGQLYFVQNIPNRLLRTNADGTGLTELKMGGAYQLAVDATSVYYTVPIGGGGVGNNDYRICKIPR